jgi:DNA-binding transcriptional MerR regulator/effector-binding domain-containing protein
MFKIGEFSQMAQVSTRMLRHYDKLGLLQPSVVDHFTGYRYYTLEQMPRLNRILALKDLGFSLSDVGDLLHDNISVEEMRGMLRMRQAEITRVLLEEQLRLAHVAARLRQIEFAGQPTPYEVVIKQPTSLTLTSQRAIVPHVRDMAAYRCTMFEDLYVWLSERHIEPDGTEMVMYYGQEFAETQIDMETAVPIPADAFVELKPYQHGDIQLRTLEEPLPLATTILQGSIYDLPQAITAIFTWIHTSGYCSTGVIRELHLSGPERTDTNFDAITFELQIPVQTKA